MPILLIVCNTISMKNVIKSVKSVKLLNVKMLNVKSLKFTGTLTIVITL